MDFSEVLEKRRAVNFFDPEKEVSDEELKAIVEDAAKTPSSFNLQPWNLVVLRDHEEKARLRKLAWDQPKITDAPVVLMVLADRKGWQAGNEGLEKLFKNNVKSGIMTEDKYQWFTETTGGLYGTTEDRIQAFACKNAGLFAMSLMYSASSRGLQTHPMDGFDLDGVTKEFNIPDQYWLTMLIAVGHLKQGIEIFPKAWRKSYEDIVKKF
jgi:nitroreductase